MRHPTVASFRKTVICLVGTLSLASVALAACGDDGDGGGAGSFCDEARSYRDANNMVPNPATASREELESKYTELQDALDEMKDSAPSDIEDDIATVATIFDRFIEAFASKDYDYAKFIDDPAGRQAADALSSEEMAASTGAIERYIAAECG